MMIIFLIRRIAAGAIMAAIVMLARYYLNVSPFVVLCGIAFIVGYEIEQLNQRIAAVAWALKEEEE